MTTLEYYQPSSRMIKNIFCAALVAGVTFSAPMVSTCNLLRSKLTANSAASRLYNIPPNTLIRTMKIREVRGKYAFVPTSSESFSLRKQMEINQEG